MEQDPLGSSDYPGSVIDRYVGERLQRRRLAHGLSVSTVAQTLGVPETTVLAWEAGLARIPAGQLLTFSQLLSYPLTTLFEEFRPDTHFDRDIEPSETIVNSWFSRHSAVKH